MEPQTWTDFFVSLMPAIFMILLWLMPVLIAFARLQKQAMEDTAKAVWILIILLIPIVGALTYILLFSERQHGLPKG